MYEGNVSRITEVWITGIELPGSITIFLYVFFLTIYLMILIGNLLIISAVASENCLHSPMYFFLSSLSLSEILFTTNLIPEFLHVLWEGGAAMYLDNCLAQFYLCGSLGATECLLFASMSYDRYVAICKPLHYFSVMNVTFCGELILFSWICAFASMSITLILVTQLYFCGLKIIDHFFCDFAPILQLSCSDTYVVEVETFIFTSSVTLFPFMFVIGTYVCIIFAIIKIPSSKGREKTFSTCSSHLAAVCTYYGSLIIVYVVPTHNFSRTASKTLSLIYTVVTPLFNPIIYSLRNKQIKLGVKKCLKCLLK
ncbi:olfactory receptor 11L1-like [Hyperolius riggenbachi]|uniref:olfactory receptor 11L1-like n=1 Tax=Hyperolius riggenbachi TaxID=752182 RepID=UPI0035A26282